jgi:hypothetical protein
MCKSGEWYPVASSPAAAIFTVCGDQPNEGGHLEPGVFLAALLIFVGIPAFTVIKLARLRAARPQSLASDVTARFEALERSVQDLQQQLAETHERLDFTERLLSKAREERRIGS